MKVPETLKMFRFKDFKPPSDLEEIKREFEFQSGPYIEVSPMRWATTDPVHNNFHFAAETREERATRLAALYAKQGRSLRSIRLMLDTAFPYSTRSPK